MAIPLKNLSCHTNFQQLDQRFFQHFVPSISFVIKSISLLWIIHVLLLLGRHQHEQHVVAAVVPRPECVVR